MKLQLTLHLNQCDFVRMFYDSHCMQATFSQVADNHLHTYI